VQSGSFTVSSLSSGASDTRSITLSGFTSTPYIDVTPQNRPSNWSSMRYTVTTKSSTSFTVETYNPSGGISGITVGWMAIGW
jgi:hypothetical protein